MSAWYPFLLGAALRSVVVLAAAWIASWLLRNRSAASRHLVWTVACASLLVLPLLTVSIPVLPVVPIEPAAMFSTDVATPAAGGAAPSDPRELTPTLPAAAAWHPDWRLFASLAWAAGAVAGLLQMLLAWARLRFFRRTARHIAGPWHAAIADSIGVTGPVEVLETPNNAMPMTVGLRRPAVLIPAQAAEWHEDRRRVVLLHEFAHVRRGDVAWQLVVRIAVCLYWWNPLAWIAWREFVRERERAADDLVLTAGMRASDYANHLLEIARQFQSPRLVQSAAIAIARPSELEGRLLSILNSGIDRSHPGRAFACAAVLVAVLLVVPLAALRGQAPLPADIDAVIRAAAAQKNYGMLDDAAKVARERMNLDAAQKLLESSLALRGEVSGANSVEYGLGLVKLGDLARLKGRLDGAEANYAKAAALLAGKPQAALALGGLGVLALIRKDPAQAFGYFDQARAADPVHDAPAKMWMAIVRERQQNTLEAESLYREAVAAADPGSPEAALALELCAQFLQRTARDEEAQPMLTRAGVLRQTLGTRPKPSGSSVYRMGGESVDPVTRPELLSKVEPVYSEEARLAKYQGTVVLYAEIGVDGIPDNLNVVKGLGLGLNERAIDAVRQWRFKAGTKGGQPVVVSAQIEVNWRLM